MRDHPSSDSNRLMDARAHGSTLRSVSLCVQLRAYILIHENLGRWYHMLVEKSECVIILCLFLFFYLKLVITCTDWAQHQRGGLHWFLCALNLYACLFGCCMLLVSASWNLCDLVRKALKTFLSHFWIKWNNVCMSCFYRCVQNRMARWISMASPSPVHLVLDG